MQGSVCREAENPMKLRIFLVLWLLAVGMVGCSAPDETNLSGRKQVTADEPRHVKVYFEKGTVRRVAGQSRHLELGERDPGRFRDGPLQGPGSESTTSIARSRRFRCWPEASTGARPGR